MSELISPELALIDPDLAARARAALPYPQPPPARWSPVARAAPAQACAPSAPTHPYPLWARLTAALWLLVLGILIGGAAVPHAQDRPRVLSKAEQAAEICKPVKADTGAAQGPRGNGTRAPARPGA
jgi:hypothetical protein